MTATREDRAGTLLELCSGARILTTLVSELRRRGGIAMVVEANGET
ncbi:MAG TPA: hypothetical protein VES79_07390 [Solirubrobacteraceae bacterium]|nr:hypothetical protein [Solirubrobacteraceae bacterium]